MQEFLQGVLRFRTRPQIIVGASVVAPLDPVAEDAGTARILGQIPIQHDAAIGHLGVVEVTDGSGLEDLPEVLDLHVREHRRLVAGFVFERHALHVDS